MNGQPGNWRSAFTSAAITLLGAAIALYVAVHLIEAVAPVLITLVVLAAAGYATWFFHGRRSGW
jgi:hypothetical protein